MTIATRHRQPLRQRLAAVFLRHAEETLVADRTVSFTGADLERGTARWLEAAGREIPEGGYVGVLAPPSAVQGFAVLVVLASGRVPVMLNPWTSASLRPEAAEGLHGLLCCELDTEHLAPHGLVIALDRHGEPIARRPAASSNVPPPAPAAAGLVLHTSGSTGAPKRVLLPAEGLLYTIDELIRRFSLGAGTVASVILPIYHTMALNTQFLPTVFAGGRAVISSPRWLIGRIYRDVLETGTTFVALVNELLRPSLDEMRQRRLPPATGVQDVQLAGGASHPKHLEMARELFPAARIHKGYGLTEAIRVAMVASDEAGFDSSMAGRPLPGQEIEIRDRRGEALAAGVSGEIWVRGPNVMLGYLDGEGLSTPDGGWLATGDVGHLTADGRLVVEGRGDRLFKSFGHRVAPAEIEGVALSLPGVALAGCIPVPCQARGQRPVLFLEPAAPFENGHRAELESALIGQLEPYKVPKDVVVAENLPRSAAGKVDLGALERLWQRRVADPPAEGPAAVDLGRGPAGSRFLGLGREGSDTSPRTEGNEP